MKTKWDTSFPPYQSNISNSKIEVPRECAPDYEAQLAHIREKKKALDVAMTGFAAAYASQIFSYGDNERSGLYSLIGRTITAMWELEADEARVLECINR